MKEKHVNQTIALYTTTYCEQITWSSTITFSRCGRKQCQMVIHAVDGRIEATNFRIRTKREHWIEQNEKQDVPRRRKGYCKQELEKNAQKSKNCRRLTYWRFFEVTALCAP